MIGFNKPYLSGKELQYIEESVKSRKISGDGLYTKKCHEFFEQRYGFTKSLLTTSCTDALEMSALLLNIRAGDEVIMPAYTFVSTANAFVLRGAKIIFCDSTGIHPNMDVDSIESLITSKTKTIVPVHYAGVACEMSKLVQLAGKHNIDIVEDAAQSIDSFYTGSDGVKKPLGSIGKLAAFSFHETKNIISGEGGMIAVNDPVLIKRAEIIREKGTNRSAFFRGDVDKYGWVDIGSSFLPSDIIAAFLYAQLETLDRIQQQRKHIWDLYYDGLKDITGKFGVELPYIPPYATNNYHMFYLVFESLMQRTRVLDHLRKHDIHAVFHYLSLHKSPYYEKHHDGRELPNCDRYADCLLRLPFYYELSDDDIRLITEKIHEALSA